MLINIQFQLMHINSYAPDTTKMFSNKCKIQFQAFHKIFMPWKFPPVQYNYCVFY